MIHTLLDNDFYAFTMSAMIAGTGHGQVPVKYAFRNRTFAVPLATRIDLGELREHIDEVRGLSFTDGELDYLQGLGFFTVDTIANWSFLKLPEVHVGQDQGHLVIEYEGPWQDAVFWETPLLSMVNELYFRQFGIACHREGNLRLNEKLQYLSQRGTINFLEFGTRRRFSRQWQEHVLNRALQEVPQLVIGTSNVHLARMQSITPVGTMAHQLFMVKAALINKTYREAGNDEPREAMYAATEWVLEDWATMYAPHLMTALPDTFGTDLFFRALQRRPHLLDPFKAFRQDSGDPTAAGVKILNGYHRTLGLDPHDVNVCFSDGLDVRKMSVIEDTFTGRSQMNFGWGTNFTNDLGVEPLAIVIKPDEADGEPCVKISDDLAKATGHPDAVAMYKEALEAN